MGLVDMTFKEMALTSLPQLVNFLMPELLATELVQLPQELPATVRSVDVLLKAVGHPLGRRLLIIECQAGRDADLHRLMLLRAALAHFFHDLPVSSLLLALTPGAVVPERHLFGYAREEPNEHGIEVRKLYEEPAEEGLLRAPPAILPLCPVMRPRDGDRRGLLMQVLDKIAQLDMPDEKRRTLLTWAGTFATLHLTRNEVMLIVNDVCRRRQYMLQPLRDLPLLRDTYQEGIADGIVQGKTTTKMEYLLEVLAARGIAVGEEVRERILLCQDGARLDEWFRRALRASTLEEVLV